MHLGILIVYLLLLCVLIMYISLFRYFYKSKAIQKKVLLFINVIIINILLIFKVLFKEYLK